MTGDEQNRVDAVFMEGLDLAEPERAALLANRLGDRADLAAEVRALWDLDGQSEADPFEDMPRAMLCLLAHGEGLAGEIGDFRIMAKLGQGGMGAVYKARQRSLDRVVALKTLSRTWLFDGHLARFKQEMKLLARMNHPHIAQVFESGETDDGRPYFTMELLDGQDLVSFHEQHSRSLAETLAMMIDVCDAVQHAHQKGIVHRDLKPSNILVIEDDGRPRAKIIDFGVAGSPGDRPIGGTPGYVAPELAGGGSADTRSDIYALGVMLGRLCCEPVRTSLPPARRMELDCLIERARAVDPTVRYASCAQLKADLVAWRENRPLEAGPDGATYPLRKWLGRNRWIVLAGLVIIVAALLGLITLWMVEKRRLQTESARIAADRERIAAERQALLAEKRAQVVNDFLVDIFRQVDPLRKGRQVPAVILLEQAAAEAGNRYEDAPDLEAAIRVALGRAFKGLGEHGKARDQHERAGTLLRLHQGADHVRTLRNQGELGYLYRLLGELDAAETVFRDCIDRLRHHPAADELVWVKGMLAELLGDRGRYEEADTLFRETLIVQETFHGPFHKSTLATRENLGRLILKRGDPAGAESVFMEVVAAWKRKGNPDHPRYLTALHNLAWARQQAGHRDTSLYRDVLERRTRVLGPAHPETLDTRNNLATLAGRNGKPKEAIALLEAGLAAGAAARGHPNLLRMKHNLGEYLMKVGEPARSEAVLRETVAARGSVLGWEHPDTLLTRVTLGQALTHAGRYADAATILREAVSATTCIFGPTARVTGLYRAVLGWSLLEAGKHEEAEDHLLNAYHLLGRAGHPWAHKAVGWLEQARKARKGLAEAEGGQ